jgi:ATP-dependent DNA helicase Rep
MPSSREVCLAGLNPEQRAAVVYIDGPLLVLAGAGSGKTRVITRKIAWLIGECGTAAANIAALTFTNKAAREMKARVTALLGGKRGAGLHVSTFHSLGLAILRAEYSRLGYRRGFSLFDAEDSRQVVREILKSERADRAEVLESVYGRISMWKSALVSPEAALAEASDAADERAARAYAAYQRYLHAYNALDFDDLIVQPARLFESDRAVLDAWQNRLRYLLVDEYQDTNGAQYRLLKLLAGPRAALTAVGDDDQSVYSWRGARPENLALLKEDYPRLKVIKLEQNYRSAPGILRAANGLIAHNQHVFEKRLWSELADSAPVTVLSCENERDEAERIAARIVSHRLANRLGFGDYAVLYRGNHQARLVERALREQQVPYQVSGGTSFFNRSEIKDIVAYLRLIANPDDDAAFLRIVNVPRREIGATTLEKLGRYAGERATSLFNTCFVMGLAAHLNDRARERLWQFAEFIGRLGEREAAPSALARELIEAIGYERWLLDNCKNPKTAARRMDNVGELLGWLENLGKRNAEQGLAQMLNHMSLMDRLNQADADAAGERVQLMTLHAAKGLEFACVFLIGFEEELLPHRENMEGPGLEEERRLVYVGMTRARRHLFLTHAAKRRRYGEEVAVMPSRFLEELPAKELDWAGRKENLTPEVRIERGREHLAALRSVLKSEFSSR